MPVPVTIERVCPPTLPELPAKPVRTPCPPDWPQGSVCYAPEGATQLGLLLDVLGGLYRDRKACENGPHARANTR